MAHQVRVEERQHLCHEDGSQPSARVNPVVRVVKAAPSQRSCTPHTIAFLFIADEARRVSLAKTGTGIAVEDLWDRARQHRTRQVDTALVREKQVHHVRRHELRALVLATIEYETEERQVV